MSETVPVQDANKGRMLFADVTRAAAILMVILLHSSALYFYQDGTPLRWHFANIVNSFTRPAVPLFLMLSGALLLSPDRKETPLKFLRHQFSKILPSLLFWSVFYYLIGAYGAGAAFSVPAFFDGLVRGNLYYHLPFLYYLLGLYLTYPLLRSFFRGANQGEGLYFLVVWLATVVIAGISKYFNFGVSANLLIFFSFIGFPIIGWLIHSFEGAGRFSKMAAAVFLLGWLATAMLTWYQKANGAYAEFFYEYLSPNVVFSSLAMFYLFRFIDWNSYVKGSVYRLVSIISTHSFDVFLIHPFILLVLKVYIVPQRLTVHAFSGILILFILTSVFSVLSAMILDFLKTIFRTRIKHLLPGAA